METGYLFVGCGTKVNRFGEIESANSRRDSWEGGVGVPGQEQRVNRVFIDEGVPKLPFAGLGKGEKPPREGGACVRTSRGSRD
jgi:hypothetical protein